MSQFYFLPPEYIEDEHGALGECISGVLYSIRAKSDEPWDEFLASNVLGRLFEGNGNCGESVDAWEIMRWKYRSDSELGLVDGDYLDNDFLVWVDEASYFKPNWKVYKESEFLKIFGACCRNFVAEYPEKRVEIADALSKHGISL